MRFGADPVAWDGTWTCVAFSIPEADADRRARLRRRLRALGLGALFDGLWITPHAPVDALDRCLADLGVAGAAVLRATEVPLPAGVALTSAWDLASLRAGYDELAALVDGIAGRLGAGAVTPAEAFVARSGLMRAWRALAMADPLLPDALLPAGWPRRAVREGFIATYDALGPWPRSGCAPWRARQAPTPSPATTAWRTWPARPSPAGRRRRRRLLAHLERPRPLGAVTVGSRPSAVAHRQSPVGSRPSAVGRRPSAVGRRQSAVGRDRAPGTVRTCGRQRRRPRGAVTVGCRPSAVGRAPVRRPCVTCGP